MKVFILDVDGVMTTGQFLYSETGKQMKVFGPDDHKPDSLQRGAVVVIFDVREESHGCSSQRSAIPSLSSSRSK